MRVRVISWGLGSFLLFCGASLAGCEPVGYPAYDRTQLLTEVTDSLIVPALHEQTTRATSLHTATTALCTTTNATTLAAARAAWVDALVAWNGTVAYQIGPAATLDFEAHASWPADSVAIEAIVDGTDEINAHYVDTLGAPTRGFTTLEYLLFAYPGYTTADDAMTLTALGNTRRCMYAEWIADELARLATQLETAWSPSGGNFRDVFVNASDPNTYTTPQAAVNALVSQVVEAIDQVRDDKVGTPLGLTTHTGGVQSPYAHASVAAMEACLRSASDAWLGTPHGLDAFLRTRNERLATSVSSEFTAAEAAVMGLESPPLTPAWESYATGATHTEGDAAYDRLQTLQTSLSTDVAATLGLSLVLPGDGD